MYGFTQASAYMALFFRHVLSYVIRIGDCISQLLNVAILFGDNPNESISGRCYRNRKILGWAITLVIIDFIAYPFERNHCRVAWEADIERAKRLIRQSGA